MKKLRFLLLDANVVFQLFEMNLWDQCLDKCEIILSRVVAEQEVRYYRGDESDKIIDLSKYAQQLSIVDIDAAKVLAFKGLFTNEYLEKLDPGEAESLCYLANSDDECFISSSDAIVFRVLACLNLSERGLSLQEVLKRNGMTKALPWQFRKEFRLKYTREGQEEMLTGRALKAG